MIDSCGMEMKKEIKENKDKPIIIHIPMCEELCTRRDLFDINVRIPKNANEAFISTWNASKFEWYAIVQLNKTCDLFISYQQDDDGNYWGLIMPPSFKCSSSNSVW